MAKYSDMVALAMPRNGGTTFTNVDPASSGTVVAGTRFTPTAARLLVVVAYGAITLTTPAGWTLPTNGSAINNGGLYVWHRTAAGSDVISSTSNGTNYPAMFAFYQYAAGSTFMGSASATAVAKAAGAGPTLTVGAGTKQFQAVAGQGYDLTTGSAAYGTWGGSAVEDVDSFTIRAGTPTTDGYGFGSAYIEDSTSTSQAIATTLTSNGTNTVERLVWAVQVASAVTLPIYPKMAPYRS